MKKALMTASVPSMIGQFNMNNIQILQELGYEVHVACNFYDGSVWTKERTRQFIKELKRKKIRYHQIGFPRSPLDIRGVVTSFQQLKRLTEKEEFDLMHCHTPVASVISRAVAHEKKIRVIYTAHGFHFYTGAPLKNWLIYFPIEWVCSWWTDTLITINKEDYARAGKLMHARRVTYIPGVGIDLKKFSPNVFLKSETALIRRKLGVSDHEKILLSVGELSPRKNHESVIRAIAKLNHPNIKYFICGTGALQEHLQKLIDELGMSEKVKLLGYRADISELCCCADLFVLPSVQEGLPVALMEAVASKIPVICSRIRGNTDLIKSDALFEARDVDGISEKIIEYLFSDKSKEVEHNYQILKKYDMTAVIHEIRGLYSGGVNLYELYECQRLRLSIGVPLEATLLLSVGELNENKNHAVILRAMMLLQEKNVHYVIAGEGVMHDRLLEMTRKYNIEDRVHLIGFCNDIPRLCKIADVCVFPSIREGLGMAAIEGMASGLPLIVSDNRGTRGFLKENMAFTCRYDDADGFAKAIKYFVKNEDVRISMGKVNAEVVRRFDIGTVNKIMYKAYSSLR